MLPALLAAAATLSGCSSVLPVVATGAYLEEHSTTSEADMFVPVALGAVAIVAAIALMRRANDRDEPTSVTKSSMTSDDARIERMFVQGRVLAAENNCAAVHGLGRAVERVAPEMAVAFTSDPGIARCY